MMRHQQERFHVWGRFSKNLRCASMLCVSQLCGKLICWQKTESSWWLWLSLPFMSCDRGIWFNSIERVQIRPSSDSVAHSYFTISFHMWQRELFKIRDSTILCYINPVGWVSPIQFLFNFTSSSASYKPVPDIVLTLFTEFASVINIKCYQTPPHFLLLHHLLLLFSFKCKSYQLLKLAPVFKGKDVTAICTFGTRFWERNV